MRRLEVAELAQKPREQALDIRRLEHIRAHELRERVDLLQRDRLLEEVERLLLPDAEELAEVASVERIVVVRMDEIVRLEPLAERAHIAAEARETLRDGERLFREHIEARRRRRTLRLVPEDLRERDRAAEILVGKYAEDHAVFPLVAQRLGAARPLRRRMVRVVAAHVGAQTALLRARVRRLVVGDAARRHEQRDDGVDERRFARADIAREQRRRAREVERPDLAVERAPVVDLEPREAEPELRRARRLLKQVHRHPPLSPRPSAPAAASSLPS